MSADLLHELMSLLKVCCICVTIVVAVVHPNSFKFYLCKNKKKMELTVSKDGRRLK